jgi:hypothetical protein
LLLCVIVNNTTDTVGLMEARLLKYQQFSDHDIRVRAYLIWTREGRPDGGPQEFWRKALSELNAECHAAIGGQSLDHLSPRPEAATPPVRTVSATVSKL